MIKRTIFPWHPYEMSVLVKYGGFVSFDTFKFNRYVWDVFTCLARKYSFASLWLLSRYSFPSEY